MSMSIRYVATAPIGSSQLQINGVTAPAQFVPRFLIDTRYTSNGANVSWRLRGEYPLINTVDDVVVNNNTFRLSFEFTALQNVSNLAERTALLDNFIAFVTANKSRILDGSAIIVASP